MSVVHACYPGSFDPVTRGHLDVVRRAAAIFGRLTVGVGLNAGKSPLFTPEERAEMIRAEIGDLPGVDVEVFGGLVVDWCRQRGIAVMVRGLRSVSDFETPHLAASRSRFPTVSGSRANVDRIVFFAMFDVMAITKFPQHRWARGVLAESGIEVRPAPWLDETEHPQ